jgi:hypothetical protein
MMHAELQTEQPTWRAKVALQTEQPIWIRCSQDGQLEPHTGLSAAVLGYLVRPGPWNNFDPPVKSRRVKTRGNNPYKYGALLISLQSLLDYIESCPDSKQARQLATSARQAAKEREVTVPKRRRKPRKEPVHA